MLWYLFFFFNDTATTEIYTLSLHDALPILERLHKVQTARPFRILIATILSARTKDENTTKAADKLFKLYGTPQKLAKAKVKDVEKVIKSVGFYHVKSKRIIEVANLILSKYNGKVPADIDKIGRAHV